MSPVASKGTKKRTVRISDETWVPAQAKAERRGESLAEIMRKRVEEYLAED